MAFFRKTLVALSALVVSGCTAAQVESGRMQKVLAETKTSGEACVRNVSNKSEYAPLASKTVLYGDQYSLEMLADKTLPNKKEISLLYKLHDDVQECRKITLEGLSKLHPSAVTPVIEGFSEGDKLAVEMVGGKLTWGDYNERRKTITAQVQVKLVQAGQQIDAQLQNQHEAEIAQRQQAAAAIQQWSYQQQVLANQRAAITAANRPVTTNCNAFGSSINCTSY